MIPGLLARPPILDICQTKQDQDKDDDNTANFLVSSYDGAKAFLSLQFSTVIAKIFHMFALKLGKLRKQHCIFHYTILGQEVMERKIVAKRPKSERDIMQS